MSETKREGPRTKGRPPTIDRVAALDAAILTFWEKGYEGASLTDLTDAMQLSRPSLYSAFGDKAALFDAGLVRFAETIGGAPMAAFEAAPDIEQAVRAFLKASAEGNTEKGRPTGCLIACCAPAAAGTDRDVRERLRALQTGTLERLERRLRSETGLPASPTPAERASLMLDFINAQAIRARAGASRAELIAGLEPRVKAVLAGFR